MDPWKILLYPQATEKSINLIQTENEIIFFVNRKANKKEIKEAFEKVFDVKVKRINILIDFKGRKKAFIKLKPEFKAIDVAAKLGIM